MRLRVATANDLPAIKKLALESPTAVQWSEGAYHSLFRSDSLAPRHLLVADKSGTLLGFIAARQVDSLWELENVAVAAAWHQKGIGKRLVAELLRLAQSHYAAAIHLEVRESNRAARRLYESCGFQKSGRRSSYYAAPVENAILYSFSFSSPGK